MAHRLPFAWNQAISNVSETVESGFGGGSESILLGRLQFKPSGVERRSNETSPRATSNMGGIVLHELLNFLIAHATTQRE